MNPSEGPGPPEKLQKTLARLLPAFNLQYEEDSGPAVYTPTFSLSKRPRIGVLIACNNCRIKKTRVSPKFVDLPRGWHQPFRKFQYCLAKGQQLTENLIQCDGGKPACWSCQKRGKECVYEDPNLRGAMNGDLLLEAVGLLNTLTPSRAIATLLSVADQESSTEVIDTIREAADKAAQESNSIHELAGTTSSVQELALRHPFTYPQQTAVDHDDATQLVKNLLTSLRYKRRMNKDIKVSESRENSPEDMTAESLALPRIEIPVLDPELEGLRIAEWTSVPVSDDFAARAISLYLSADHNLLSPFHRGYFLRDLVNPHQSHGYCSSAMVNALMYWCCQMYSGIESAAITKTDLFRQEAQELLAVEIESPQPTTMVAAMFLSLGHLAQGKDHALVRHLSEAAEIGVKLNLFGVPEDAAQAALDHMTSSEAKALAYPSWGVFNWIVLIRMFYRQQNVPKLEYPPVLSVPDSEGTSKADRDHMQLESELGGQLPSHSSAGDTFVALCHFWRIMHDVSTVYYDERMAPDRQPLTLQYAEFKFRELLAWTDELPLTLARSGINPHYVVTLHLWLHSAILDIFRPFLQGNAPHKRRLRTFASPMNTPDAAYDASVEQLKRLIVTYRSKYPVAQYSIIWQTSLLYTANAMLHSMDEDRLTYFLICLYSYADMRQSFRVTEAIVSALLSMGMQNGVISAAVARRVLKDLRDTAPQRGDDADEQISAPFIADLDQAVTAPESATAEAHAAKFEENAMLRDYTYLFDLE